jgi:hypothetical protein
MDQRFGTDPAQLTPAAIALWRDHLKVCVHPVLRARHAYLLWEFEKQVDGTKPALQYAQTAVDAYLAAAAQPGAASHDVVIWLNRAINIATSVGDQTRL